MSDFLVNFDYLLKMHRCKIIIRDLLVLLNAHITHTKNDSLTVVNEEGDFHAHINH